MSHHANNSELLDYSFGSNSQEMSIVDDRGAVSLVSLSEFSFDGVHVFSSVCRQEEPVRYSMEETEPSITMYFSLRGSSAAEDMNGNQLALSDNQHILSYTSRFEGYYVTESPRLENFGIIFQPSFFQRLMTTGLDCMKRFEERMQKGPVADLSDYPMPVTPAQKMVIREIQHCPYTGNMQRLFIESKITELFLLQVQQAEERKDEKPLRIRPADLEKLHAARHFIKQHLFDPISLQQVARESGLNEFKLKRGFRELFGTTVFGYLNELRMNHARKMLMNTSSTVFEVAYTLGYSEPHNFSKAFQKFFGYSPGKLKN